MREILLRAYDKGRKEYLTYGNLFIAISKGEHPNKNEVYLDVINNPDRYKERFIIEQYTGLTDENGQKIFEGDIVKFGDIKGVINYNCGCFCVKTNKPDWKSRNNPAIDIIFNEYPNDIEVIGNIHKNSYLLD